MSYKIVGYDTFEACSRADDVGVGWYEIADFATEHEAIRRAAFIVKRLWKPRLIQDHIYVRHPSGDMYRCVFTFCSECRAPLTATVSDHEYRIDETSAVCKSCGREIWKEAAGVLALEEPRWSLRGWLRSIFS